MRLLFMTMLASLGATLFGFVYPSAPLRILRRGPSERHPYCRHCGINEIANSARLCAHCYWNLPGSRVQEYISQQ
jgi:hypothetical protein